MRFEDLEIGNAAGTAKGHHEFLDLLRSAATQVVMGSYTLEPCDGNRSDTGEDIFYFSKEGWSLNARGLPNIGIDAYIGQDIATQLELARVQRKKLIVSIAGFSIEECRLLVRKCVGAGIKHIELNGSCGNKYDATGGRQVIPSLDPELMRAIINAVAPELGPAEMTVKISPDDNWVRLNHLMLVLSHPAVSGVVGVNSDPGVEKVRDDDTTPALSYNGGKHAGGLAGTLLRKKALRVARFVGNRLEPRQSLTYVGGISCGSDVVEGWEAGATAFQIGTRVYQYGPRVIGEVAAEVIDG